MTSNFTTNYIPVGIGYDSDGNAKGLVELSSISVASTASVQLVHTNVAADYAILADDTLLYVSGPSPITITLPLAADNTYRVVDIYNKGSTTVTVDGNGSETINGSLTKILSSQYDTITLHCDGSEWSII